MSETFATRWPSELLKSCPRCGNVYHHVGDPALPATNRSLWFSDVHVGCYRCHHREDRKTWNQRPMFYEWPMMPSMSQGEMNKDLWYSWHYAINEHNGGAKEGSVNFDEMKFMYDAKHAAEEVPRLAALFQMEREGKLTKVHRQCSHSEAQPVENNHLSCCLGVKCKECPHLQALDKTSCSPKSKDWIKSWTCVAHILSKGGDLAGEGFLMTVDDRMYWDSVYTSLAGGPATPDVTQQP